MSFIKQIVVKNSYQAILVSIPVERRLCFSFEAVFVFARYENGVQVRYFYWSMFETMDVCERLKLFCVRRSSLRTKRVVKL